MVGLNMKKNVLALFVFLSTIGITVLSYSQQDLTPQQRRQLQTQVENLKQRILQVEQLLQAFNNNAARNVLLEAKKLGEQIESEFRQGRYGNVLALIRTANNTLDRILAIATDGTLKRLVSELKQVMQQADFEVLGGGNKEAERILRSAKQLHERAEASLQAGKVQKAYEQFTVAITFARQALDMVHDACQRERAQFQNMVTRAQNAIDASQNDQAKRISEQAFKSYKLAEQACQEGRSQAAAQLYNRAMRLLLRAIDLTSSGGAALNEAELKIELETAREMLASVKSRFDANDQQRGQALLQRAEENIRNAESLLANGRFVLAKAQLLLARRLLKNVLRIGYPDDGDVQDKAESELALLQQDIARFERSLPADQPAADYLALVRQAALRAEQAIAAGRYGSALQRILIAQKFLAKAETSGKDRNHLQITQALVQQNIDELLQRLKEAESALHAASASQANDLLEDARAMLRQAESKRQQGKLLLAFQLSEIGKELIATALRVSQSQD